jgi:hypothetical protein
METTKMKTEFTFISDPGHGWLIVTRDDLADVGLTEADISPYSYQSAEWIALEEDCDAATFVKAWEAKTRWSIRDCIKEFHIEHGGPRNWRQFGGKIMRVA